MKLLILTILLAFTNAVCSQHLIINNGADTIYYGGENEIKIKTTLENIVLQADCGELRKVAENYYTFKTCSSKDSAVKFILQQKGQPLKDIQGFNFKIVKAPKPIVVFEKQNIIPVGVRVVSQSGADIIFVVKSYQFEILKKDGSKLSFENEGSILNDEGYMAYRELKQGDSFRIINVIARNPCESKDRTGIESDYFTVIK